MANLKEKDILAQADDLAQNMMESEIYAEYVAAYDNLKYHKYSKELVDDIKSQHIKLNIAMIAGGADNEKEKTALDELYQAAEKEPAINEFLNAEYRLMKLVGGVYKLLFKDLETLYETEDEEQTGLLN